MAQGKALARSFYERDTRVVAFELIGKILFFENKGKVFRGEIVETEAYLGASDPASHAYRGETPRTRVMFGPPGFSYVYFTYGFHHCLNVVTEQDGTAGAVLIRALKPIEDIDAMKAKRPGIKHIHDLTNGPGKLAQAFGLTREHSGLDLTKNGFHLEAGDEPSPFLIDVTPRIGIREAKDFLFRFARKDSPFVSGKLNKKTNGIRR